MENKYFKKIITQMKETENIIIFLMIAIIATCVTAIIINIVDIHNSYKVYKQYEEQLSALQKQEIEKKQEAERIRQERLPKLTQTGRQNIENIYRNYVKQEQARNQFRHISKPTEMQAGIVSICFQYNMNNTMRKCLIPPYNSPAKRGTRQDKEKQLQNI